MTTQFFSGDTYVKMATARSLFLNEEFTDQSCLELITMLLYLDSVSNDPITIYINSPGGIVSGFFGIYDVINYIKSPVRTICTSSAASCGALLLSCGRPGQRYAMKNSEIMIHGMTYGFPYGGKTAVSESEQHLKFFKKYEEDVFKILAKNTGKSLEKIKQDCLIDYYMSAKEAKDYGIIDHII